MAIRKPIENRIRIRSMVQFPTPFSDPEPRLQEHAIMTMSRHISETVLQPLYLTV